MALADCATGFVRLFFIAVKFGINHLGWLVLFFIGLAIIFWIFKAFGIAYVPAALAILIIFLVFFFGAAYLTGAPLCEFADQVSQMLV